jgi:hypothetical protein
LAKNVFLIDPFWRFLARFLARLNKLKSFCWRLLRCVPGAGEWALAGPGPRPGGAERLYFWAAAIRFSLKYLFNRSVFRRFFAQYHMGTVSGLGVSDPFLTKIINKKRRQCGSAVAPNPD